MKGKEMKTLLPIKEMEATISSKHSEFIGNLSLFSKETTKSPHRPQKLPQESIARPVTPIQDEIKRAPKELSELQRLIRRRIQPRGGIRSLSKEEQLELAGVILSEVNYCWLDFRYQVQYPFLNEAENLELNRRITVYLVSVCSQLLDHFLAKGEVLSRRVMFTKEVNLTRLKTQLSTEARRLLKILTVRRYILADFHREIRSPEERDKFIYPSMSPTLTSVTQEQLNNWLQTTLDHSLADLSSVEGNYADNARLTLARLVEKFRPSKITNVQRFTSLREDLTNLLSQLPRLDIDTALELIRNMPWEKILSMEQEMNAQMQPANASPSGTNPSFGHPTDNEWNTFKRRSSSLPSLERYRKLSDDFLLNQDSTGRCKDTDSLSGWHVNHQQYILRKLGTQIQFAKLTRDDIRKDLLKMQETWNTVLRSKMPRSTKELLENQENVDNADDIPPLLQAVSDITNAQHIARRNQILLELNQREERRQAEARSFKIAEPFHPQPATITKQMGIREQTTVRISDVRPSVRECMSRLTIQLFGPVWNDIRGEIDKEMIQKLDSCLFSGDEIREVYKEIMKTVPRDHMLYTQDPMVAECPEEVDLGPVMPSTLLYRASKKHRILNRELPVSELPPWGQTEREEWQKANIFSAGDKKGSAILQSVSEKAHKLLEKEVKRPTALAAKQYQTADQQNLRLPPAVAWDTPDPLLPPPSLSRKYVLNVEEFQTGVVDIPQLMQERVMRSYGAWLQWWRDWFHVEDYKKFLLTKQSDYLHHVFHLYESKLDDPMTLEEEEAEDADVFHLDSEKATQRAIRTRQVDRLKEEDYLKEKLKKEKGTYEKGFWNPNSVLLGGLGKDPILSEEMLRDLYDRYDAVSEAELISRASRRSRHSYIGRSPGLKVTPAMSQSPNELHNDSAFLSESNFASPEWNKTKSNALKPDYSAVLCPTLKPMGGALKKVPSKEEITLQKRWDKIWLDLRMPDHERLNMAIKYGAARLSEEAQEHLLRSWEKATDAIVQREKFLLDLENFERFASNPNRFFEPGMSGSSISRMEEAKVRQEFNEKLEILEDKIKKLLMVLEVDYRDRATYAGRAYIDKMKLDRTEMLYWLQEERRGRVTNATRASLRLPPLDMSVNGNVSH